MKLWQDSSEIDPITEKLNIWIFSQLIFFCLFVLKFWLLRAWYQVFRHTWKCWCFTVFIYHMVFISHHTHHNEMVGFPIFSAGEGSHHCPIPVDPVCNVAEQFCREGGGVQEHQGVAMRYQKTQRGWYALLCGEIRGISGSRSEQAQAA